MKTFTEFSTLVLRRAAAAKAANASLEGDALAEAIATALGVATDRVPRVLEALEIVGDQLDNLRLVRVYQGETGPHGAVSRGEFHYALDRVVAQRGGGRRQEGGRGGRGERGGDRGGGGDRGERRDKPRGLGSLIKAAAGKPDDDKQDDRPARGEIPRAGIGWQLTSAPREFRGDDRGGPRGRRKGPGGPGRGRPRGEGDAPGGPGGDDRRRGPRPQGDRPRGPRPERAAGPRPQGDRPQGDRPQGDRPQGDRPPQAARPPRDPNAPRRERKPLGPDANGMGPDGTPWDPERKRKRDEERARAAATVNASAPAAVAAADVDTAAKE